MTAWQDASKNQTERKHSLALLCNIFSSAPSRPILLLSFCIHAHDSKLLPDSQSQKHGFFQAGNYDRVHSLKFTDTEAESHKWEPVWLGTVPRKDCLSSHPGSAGD